VNRRTLVTGILATAAVAAVPGIAAAQTPTLEELFAPHVLNEWSRSYESETMTKSTIMLMVVASELDDEDIAKRMFEETANFLRNNAVSDGITLSKEFETEPLVDQHLFMQGTASNEGMEFSITYLVIRDGLFVHLWYGAGFSEQTSMLTDLYAKHFSDDRVEDDVLPTVSEVPAHLTLSEENYPED
jgi:hypothetical protein